MGSWMEYIFLTPRTKYTQYFRVQNVLGISVFCPWIQENVLHPITHDRVLTAMFLIQVHNLSTKVKKCTGLRSRTQFSGVCVSSRLGSRQQRFPSSPVAREDARDLGDRSLLGDGQVPKWQVLWQRRTPGEVKVLTLNEVEGKFWSCSFVSSIFSPFRWDRH